MKLLSCFSLLVFVMLISFPVTSDAFSRRSHHSEMTPQTAPLNTLQTQPQTRDVSAQAVPEPPALLLISIGLGLLAVGLTFKRFRRPDSSQNF